MRRYPCTELERVVFTQGDCWWLARLLHHRSGWPMFATGASDEASLPTRERWWTHVVLLTPNGDYLDIEGCYGIDRLRATWGEPYPITDDDFPWIVDAAYVNLDIDGTRAFTPEIDDASAEHVADRLLAWVAAHARSDEAVSNGWPQAA